jgi:hypothetical protein
MRLTNKIGPGATSIPQQFNRQAGPTGQVKTVVAQLKTRVMAQSIKHPVAPPVYRPDREVKRPQVGPSRLTIQPKSLMPARGRKLSVLWSASSLNMNRLNNEG